MSLRTLPPEQRVTSRWRRLRYVPLSILAAAGLALGVVGAVLAPTHPPVASGDQPATLDPVEPEDGADRTTGLPAACRQPVTPPASEPWLGGDRSAAEADWQSHSAELEQPFVTWQEGFYDWGDLQNDNLSQSVGRRVLSTDEATQWHDYIAGLQSRLAESDIPLYVVVTPAKWGVYPELLPEWTQPLRGSTALDQLVARYPDLPIVDIRAPLREVAAEHAVFSKTNSHWSDFGARAGWDAVADCIAADDPELGDLSAPPISGVDVQPDRNEWADYGVADPEPNFTVPIYDPELLEVDVTDADGRTTTQPGDAQTQLLDLPVSTRTPDARTPGSVLLARDSFGNALAVPVQQVFAATWQVRHSFDDLPENQQDLAALAVERDVDVVILQVAERHLISPPAL